MSPSVASPLVGEQPLPGTVQDPLYPESDGQPMGETGPHVEVSVALLDVLRSTFGSRNDVYIGLNMYMYFQQGNPSVCKVPDVYVAFGVRGNHLRRTYKVWEEGVPPAFILETVSESTWETDLVEKRAFYALHGVAEYFLFDPEDRWIQPALQGFRLHGGVYRPIELNARGYLPSLRLGLDLTVGDGVVRPADPVTGEILLTSRERVEQERQRADRERERADWESQQAAFERQQTETERERAAALEAELHRLRAEIDRLQRKFSKNPPTEPPA